MSQPLSIDLSPEIRKAVDDLSRSEGIPVGTIISRALQVHLWARRFTLLRERMVAHAKQRGINSDQDVFDRIS